MHFLFPNLIRVYMCLWNVVPDLVSIWPLILYSFEGLMGFQYLEERCIIQVIVHACFGSST